MIEESILSFDALPYFVEDKEDRSTIPTSKEAFEQPKLGLMNEDNSMVLEQQQQTCLPFVIVDEDPLSIKVCSSKVEDLFWDVI